MLSDKKGNTEDIPIEEDVPKNGYKQFPIDNANNVKPNEVTKDVFNTIKGHNLLGWCVALLLLVYLIETYSNKGGISPVGENFIEIIKLLIFSLTGYLFGTNANNKE
ncbi:hypothetical protein ACTMS3_04645 [Streptococcus suis]|uniref:hypothetical protein n=1 Tax=Streptococcus suis TaxID=1307 RepID=UPI000C1A0510|nr:hypothetical protein [Streptococcus suis]